MTVNAQGFIIDVVVFTVVVALMTPFLATSMRRGNAGRRPSAGWR